MSAARLPSNPSTPKRKPLYPSSMSHSRPQTSSSPTPLPRTSPGRVRPRRDGKAKVNEPIKYQSLEQLLAQAGYAETRIITPESIRIKERAAWVRAEEEEEEEEKKTEALKELHEEGEVEKLLFEELSESETEEEHELGLGSPLTARLQRYVTQTEPEPEHGSFKRLWSAFNIGKDANCSTVFTPPALNQPRQASSPRRSARQVFSEGPSSPSAISFTTPSSTVDPVPLHDDECGSLSSSFSTSSNTSTVIASPPDSNLDAFASDEEAEEVNEPSWSIQADVHVESFPASPASARTIRPFPPPSRTLDPSPQAAQPSSSFAHSEAARSLRKITSCAQMQPTAKPKPSSSFGLFSLLPGNTKLKIGTRPAPSSTEDTLLRRTLRHTASTPLLARHRSSTPQPSQPVPPLPSSSWFDTLKRGFQAVSSSTPSDAMPTPPLRSRGSIPIFRQTSAPAVLSPTKSQPASIHLRSSPLVPKVTASTVVCGSEEGEDLPPFSPRIPLFSENEAGSPEIPSPVLCPKASFGEGEGWSRTGQTGWVWTNDADDREEEGWYLTPSSPLGESPLHDDLATISSPSTNAHPRPNTLKAKRSITSLRATLKADSTALKHRASEANLRRPSSPVAVRKFPVPVFCISSPGTIELGFPPRLLDVEEEERRAAALVASRRESDLGGMMVEERRRGNRKGSRSRRG